MSKSLEQQIKEVLDLYNVELQEVIEKAVDKTAKEGKEVIKQHIRTKIKSENYAKSITVRKENEKHTKKRILYSKEHYRLTHLLEHGHAIANQYGDYEGKTRAFPHWIYGEEYVIDKLEKRIAEGIEGIK